MENRQPSGIKIILARHGETEWNRLHRFQGQTDIPLNTKGKKQARALALALKNETITAIYSSPLQRAVETASRAGGFHPLVPLIEEPGLMEMDLGDFEGMEAQQWKQKHEDFRRIWNETPATLAMPGGESLQDVQQRAVEALVRISTPYQSGDTLLICSHNFVIVSVLCFALGNSLDRFRELRQDTAALNVLYKDGADFIVEKVNDCEHLR